MYKLDQPNRNNEITSVCNNIWHIPFDPDNTDYQQFKKDLLNGIALNDAENNVMTAEQITAFLENLP